jgi:hypothetical protein
MKRLVTIMILLGGLLSQLFAALPAQDMSLMSLGIDYSGLWRGEVITQNEASAHERVQLLNFRYAPLPYLMVSLGFGVADYSTDTYNQTQFTGDFGFSPAFGLDCFSPFFLDKKLRITAGAKGYYLSSESADKSISYSGTFVHPGVGVIFSPTDQIDIEAGGRGLLIFGTIKGPGDATGDFSAKNTGRGYLSILLHMPSEGAYCAIDFDASPDVSSDITTDWSHGPAEASVGITVGFIISKKKEVADLKTDAAFPGYKKLQKEKDDLEKDLK